MQWIVLPEIEDIELTDRLGDLDEEDAEDLAPTEPADELAWTLSFDPVRGRGRNPAPLH